MQEVFRLLESPDTELSELPYILERVNANGIRINNLYQMKGKWVCNVTSTDLDVFYDFFEDDTPIGALIGALRKVPKKTTSPKKEDFSDILG